MENITENTAQVNEQSTTTQAETPKRKQGEYQGRYKKACLDIYEKLQSLFGVDAYAADIVAFRFAADFGRLNAANSEAKVGKVNKKGESTLKETTITKKVAVTFPIKIARAVQWADEANENFILYKSVRMTLNDECMEFIYGL
jgi:hypothetical protein